VAESLDYLATEIESRSGPGDRRDVIQTLVRETLTRHRRILFRGDNYTEEWVQEAERRGLSNHRDTPSALSQFASERNVALFDKYEVLSPRETQARSEIKFLKYAHRRNVEALSTLELASTRILPAAITYQERLARSISAVVGVGPAGGATEALLAPQRKLLTRVATAIGDLQHALEALAEKQQAVEEDHPSPGDLAVRMRDVMLPAMNAVRAQADLLETMVDDDLWPLPKYGELLSLD
jgi:glutamine synthetase